MKLGIEFQSHNYGAMASHTSIVFIRYIILEWIRRNRNDQKTYGELFYMFCEDIQDMDLTNALQSLMALFAEHIATLSADITSVLKSKVTEWIASQATFIQKYLLGKLGILHLFYNFSIFFNANPLPPALTFKKPPILWKNARSCIFP